LAFTRVYPQHLTRVLTTTGQ